MEVGTGGADAKGCPGSEELSEPHALASGTSLLSACWPVAVPDICPTCVEAAASGDHVPCCCADDGCVKDWFGDVYAGYTVLPAWSGMTSYDENGEISGDCGESSGPDAG